MEALTSTNDRKRLNFPWVTFYTLAVCLVLLPFKDILPMQGEFVSDAATKNYWNLPLADFTFVSYMFQHSGILHFGTNAITLYFFGALLEVAIGPGRTALFYLASGVIAGLAQYFAMPFAHLGEVGLSGVTFAVMTAMLCAFPGYVLKRIAAFQIKVWQVVLVIFGLQLPTLLSLGGIAGGDKNAYVIHLGGALAGFLLWAFWLRKPLQRFRKAQEFLPETEIGMSGRIVFDPSLFS